jgi:hypothetical protein
MTESVSPSIHRIVLEALPLGICVVNRDGKIILWSAGAEQIPGYLRQDVLGRSAKDNFLQYNDLESNALDGSSIPCCKPCRTATVQLHCSLCAAKPATSFLFAYKLPCSAMPNKLCSKASLREETVSPLSLFELHLATTEAL